MESKSRSSSSEKVKYSENLSRFSFFAYGFVKFVVERESLYVQANNQLIEVHKISPVE